MRYRAGRINRDRWVSPFGNRRVNACSQLTDAYRSVPRPSSPVCAKASTNCPYLTLESPHHQRHHWVRSEERHQLGRAVCVSFCQVRMIIISARLFNMMMSISGASNRSLGSLHAEALTNRRSNPRPQNRAPHGIDFKKPIHNVKYGSSRPNHRTLVRRTVSLHHLDIRRRTTQ